MCSIQHLGDCLYCSRLILPQGCEVVGKHVTFCNGTFCEVKFYLGGYRDTLRPFGRINFIDGQTGVVETEIATSKGPSENFYG